MEKSDRHRGRCRSRLYEELVPEYIEHYRRLKYSPKTLLSYMYALGLLFRFLEEEGRVAIQDVTLHDLEAFRFFQAQRGLSAVTLESIMASIRKFFRHQEEAGRLFLNPAEKLIVPRNKRRLLPVPSEEDVRRLLAQPNVSYRCGLRDRAIMEVVYSTGVRLEELLKLTIFSLRFDQGTLRVLGKGRKERVVPLGKQAIFWLKKYIKDVRPRFLGEELNEEALWISQLGRPLGYQRLQVLFRQYALKAGIKQTISPHALRRACATHMLQRGAHPIQIQLLLGHASLSNLSQYLRLNIKDLKAAHSLSKPGK